LIDDKKSLKEVLTEKKKEKLSEIPPTIEVVSDLEVYLVKNGNRVRRICGYSLPNMPEGYVCLNDAGEKTSHEGVGFCWMHDGRKEFDTDGYWRKLNLSLGIPKDLGELYARASGLGKHELLSPLNQARRVAALYWDILNNPEDENENGEPMLSRWQRQELRKLEDLWLKIIECDRRAEGQTVLKGAVITTFLQNIFNVVYSAVGREKGRRIMNNIIKITYAYHDEGKIKGDVRKIEEKVLEVEMKAEEEKKRPKELEIKERDE